MADLPDAAFAAFVAAGLWPGLGRTLGERLDAAGVRSPADVSVAGLQAVPGVNGARADRLTGTFAKAQPVYAVVELLVLAALPARLATSVVARLGDTAAAALEDDPWRLLDADGVTAEQADAFARATQPGVRRDDPRRGRALAVHVLTRAARDGHTTQATETVQAALAGFGVPDPAAAIAGAVDVGRVVRYGDPGRTSDGGPDPGDGLALARLAHAEAALAEGLTRLLATSEPFPRPGEDPDVGALDAEQRAAVDRLAEHGVSVLTGGPGTGKSRTVAAVVALAERLDLEVALAAPTGRAAKRLEELTGHPATTLHRLLQAQGRDGGFARGEDWPLEAEVVVVDEASMLDVELAAALVEACPDGTHLLLVGDPAQLPSIGPGRVLADVVDSGAVPVTELVTLHRQAEGGAIATLATAVRAGELPRVDDPSREVVVVAAGGAPEAAHRVVQLVTDSIPRALGIPAEQVQVVTPVHRGPAGTVELNRALKAVLNPGEGTRFGFDLGDRVVATANDPDGGYANGEVGVVTGVDDGLAVTFPGGEVLLDAAGAAELRHGWAITVHRAQGSEWPAVVVALSGDAAGMLSRPLVYTGFTRARRHLSIVHAAGPALARAVRDIGARPRRTQLRRLLADFPLSS